METNIRTLHVGDRVEAVFKTNPAQDLFDGVWLPLEVIRDYKYFWTCQVLPHKNPRHSWGTSHPYIMTIGKFDLQCGDIKCRPLSESFLK